MNGIIAAASVFLGLGLYQGLAIRKYRIHSPKVAAGNTIRLLLLSDLHAKYWGKEQRALMSVVDSLLPDAVMLTGDMTDATGKIDAVIDLINRVLPQYPVFFTAGNHDLLTFDYPAIVDHLERIGAVSLDKKTVLISVRGSLISISGVFDPLQAFIQQKNDAVFMTEQLDSLTDRNRDSYSILLSHRPEYIHLFAEAGFDLTLSGHTHGGQIRLPYPLNGLYASGQGFFPRYSAGLYQQGQMHMVVSRGLHQSILRPRFFNRPEAVIIEISEEKQP